MVNEETKSFSEVAHVKETKKLATNIVVIVTRSNASAPVSEPLQPPQLQAASNVNLKKPD